MSAVSVAAGPVVLMFCSRAPVSIAQRGVTHQHLAAGLTKGLGHDLAGAPCAHDAGPRVVQNDCRVLELDRVLPRDILDLEHLKRNAELLPDLLGPIGEGFGLRAKDHVAGVEEQPHLHLAAPLRVELRPSVDRAVRPGRPQLRIDAAVAIRGAYAARLVARGRA